MPRLTRANQTLSRVSSERCFVIGVLDLPRDDGDQARLQISHPRPTAIPSWVHHFGLCNCPSARKNSILQKVLWIFSFSSFPERTSAAAKGACLRAYLASMETVDGDGYSHSTH